MMRFQYQQLARIETAVATHFEIATDNVDRLFFVLCR
jgi:hypothetical protein